MQLHKPAFPQSLSPTQQQFFSVKNIHFTSLVLPDLLTMYHVDGLKPKNRQRVRQKFYTPLAGMRFIMRHIVRQYIFFTGFLLWQAIGNVFRPKPKSQEKPSVLYVPYDNHFKRYYDSFLKKETDGNAFFGNLFSKLRHDDGYNIIGLLEFQRTYRRARRLNQTHDEHLLEETNFIVFSDCLVYVWYLFVNIKKIIVFPFLFKHHRPLLLGHTISLAKYRLFFRIYKRILAQLPIHMVFTLDHKYGKGVLTLAANACDIPVFTFQHAARAKIAAHFELAYHAYLPRNDLSVSTAFFVSGENDRQLCVAHGIPSSRVYVTGISSMDSYGEYTALPHTASPNRPIKILWFSCQMIYRIDDSTLGFFAELLSDKPGIHLQIKFHPREQEKERQLYRTTFRSFVEMNRVSFIEEGANPPLIQSADVVCVENQSTTAFESLLLSVPTVIFNFKEQWELTPQEVHDLFDASAFRYCLTKEELRQTFDDIETLRERTAVYRVPTLRTYLHNEDFAATERIHCIIQETLKTKSKETPY